MPDLKISQLNVASTPLAGTELVPIVQGGITEQTTVANFLSAGLPVSASTLSTTGNVGIGTSSPGARLNVQQTVTGNITSLLLSRTTGNVGEEQSIVWQQNDLSNLQAASIAAGVDSANSGSLRFKTASGGVNTERMRLDASGNLGLGVTPSAWSGVTALQIVGSGAIASNNQYIDFTTNAYYNAGYKYIGTGLSAKYGQAAGAHQWFTAPSGTAGNAISFTQAMTLDASGNLGVGTTSPVAKLSVADATAPKFALQVGAQERAYLQYTESTFTTRLDSDGPIQLAPNNAVSATLDISGNLIQSAPTTPPALSTNGTMVFNLTSNTNLRVSVRGSDGVTRVANITLA